MLCNFHYVTCYKRSICQFHIKIQTIKRVKSSNFHAVRYWFCMYIHILLRQHLKRRQLAKKRWMTECCWITKWPLSWRPNSTLLHSCCKILFFVDLVLNIMGWLCRQICTLSDMSKLATRSESNYNLYHTPPLINIITSKWPFDLATRNGCVMNFMLASLPLFASAAHLQSAKSPNLWAQLAPMNICSNSK